MGSKRFFSRGINYSACNEDANSEIAFLEPNAQDSVCCILGGGERFFNILARSPGGRLFHLVDANPCQIHLLHLKIQAYLRLAYPDFCAFLGLAAAAPARRIELYRRELRARLPADARAYWDSETKVIGTGVIYAGKFERFLALIGTILSFVYGKGLEKLFHHDDGPAGREAVRRLLAGRRWRLITWLLCRKIWFRILLGDPAFFAFPGIGGYHAFFKSRFEAALTLRPLRENFLLALILCGRYLPETGAVPDCYRREHFDAVRARLASCEYRTHCLPLLDFLDGLDGQLDCFSLSDVASYGDRSVFFRTLDALRKRCRPHGRIVLRQLLTRYDIGEYLRENPDAYERFAGEEWRLEGTDLSFIWTFILLRGKALPSLGRGIPIGSEERGGQPC